MALKPFSINKRRRIFDDFFQIDEAEVRLRQANGKLGPAFRRLSFERGDSVAAVVLDRDSDEVVLTRQFRFPACRDDDGMMVEVMAGMLGNGEDPEEAVFRELGEELGYDHAELQEIGTFFVSPGGSSERILLYLAEVRDEHRTGSGGGVPEEGENIEILRWPLASIADRLERGEVRDAKTLIGLRWLLENVEGRDGRGRTCFVIMPFGKRDGIDFDAVYRDVIKAAVQGLGIACVRCDEEPQAGLIHSRMFRHILEADVAIVDVTRSNPNVFYELGMRHSLRDGVTILIQQKGKGRLPFNIRGCNTAVYSRKQEDLENARDQIRAFVKAGLEGNQVDSPVHQALSFRVVPSTPPVTVREQHDYRVKQGTATIGILTGDIEGVRGVDVWVNSENTQMVMARHYENAISAIIRFLGAEKDESGAIIQDAVYDALREKMGASSSVPPTHVIATDSGALAASHGVQRIFHVASVQGEPSNGYHPVQNIERCIANALRTFDEEASRDGANLNSILIPLFGTGTGRGDLRTLAGRMIRTAVDYLRNEEGSSKLKSVHFLAFSRREREVCLGILDSEPMLERI